MPAVFHNQDDIVEVGPNWLSRLKTEAAAAPLKRARLCLHRAPEDPLHEMIIVFHRDTVVPPHRHPVKSETFHVIDGELDVLIFDDSGRLARRIALGASAEGHSRIYRLSAPLWHSVIVHSEYAAIHEITNGPFMPDGTETAPWAPADENALRAFLARATLDLPPRSSD